MHCIFTDLLPGADPQGDPCALMLRTSGVREGHEQALVLVDRRLAAARAAQGRLADLDPLFALSPEAYLLDGPAPKLAAALADRGLPVVSPESQPALRWQIADYGEWNEAILSNGLTLTGRAPGRVIRPGRVSVQDHSTEQLIAAVQVWQTQVATLLPDASRRALGVTLEGLCSQRWRQRALIEALRRTPCHLAALRPDGDAHEVLLTAIEEVVRSRLGGADTLLLGAQGLPERPTPDDLTRHAAAHTGHGRRADDVARIACFAALSDSRRSGKHQGPVQKTVERCLGPASSWARAYRRHLRTPAARVVLVPTWQCELRCVYCSIGKTGGREMSDDVADQAVELLFSAPSPTLHMAFFGGEPLLRWELVRRLCDRGDARARSEGRRLEIQLTTNAWALDAEKLNDLARWNSHVQLSIDGIPALQNAQRKPRGGGDSYARGPARWLPELHRLGIDYQAIMVVTPRSADQLLESFEHLVALGVRLIQINYAIGLPWPAEACATYARGLQAVGERLEQLWADGSPVEVANLRASPVSVRHNLHVTVDHDGTVYGGNAFLFQSIRREAFAQGHLDDGVGWHRYMVDGTSDAEVVANWRRRAGVEETRRVGSVEANFVRWMQRRHPKRLGSPGKRSM